MKSAEVKKRVVITGLGVVAPNGVGLPAFTNAIKKGVPQKISDHFPEIVHPFLERNNITIEDINHLIFHPGGKKIVQTIEDLFGVLGKNIDDTKEVLRLYGNMSSATVLYVLERFMDRKPEKGERGLMLSFGPGFSAQRILLEW